MLFRSGQVELGPGERGSSNAGAAPHRAEEPVAPAPVKWRPPVFVPPAGAAEAVLRETIAAQEKELRELRAAAAANHPEPKGPFAHPSHEELLARVARCEIRYDYPSNLDLSRPPKLGEGKASELGLSAAQREAYDQAMSEVYSAHAQTMRRLYVELTGDEKTAQQLTRGQLLADIRDRQRDAALNRKMAEELAGLASPPADVSQASVRERMLRHMLTLGDDVEQRLAAVIGPEEARKLRGESWGSRSVYSGCPK